MLNRKSNSKRSIYALVALTLLLVPLLVGFSSTVKAADLLNRSISVASSEVSVSTSHTYRFRVASAVTIGSLEIEYCTNTPFVGTVCTAPFGFGLQVATMGAQTGLTGFSIHPNTTVNKLILGRAPAGVVPPINADITINAISNPSTPNQTVFARISTFASNDGTGIRGDSGTVAFSTARQISVEAFVPPYLIFCVGNTVSGNCSLAEGNYLSFGEMSRTTTAAVSSQFAVATNDPTGYITTVNGITLTSGNNVITGNATPTASIPGVSQFGLNLRANSSPSIGADRAGVGTASVQADFNIPNSFTLKDGTLVSSPLPSDFNVFTVSYIANISPNQPAGVYNSTFTYITTVSF